MIIAKDSDTRFLYKTFLEMWNYEVVELENITNSLKIIETVQPEIILLDCTLPFEENLSVIQKIRADLFFQAIPIIAISGYSQPQMLNRILRNGADEVLVKPLDFDYLRNSLQNSAEKYSLKNRLKGDSI